ncbi:hypothetical protein HanRHA438_Chr01g0000351 [Helianthus annuus]|nr:hypothetical protein HanRHA438_Chr01g0000351 [Helianthus annuus]
MTYYFALSLCFCQFLIPSVLGSDESHVTSRKLSMTVGLIFIGPRLQVSYYMVNSKTKVVFVITLILFVGSVSFRISH